MAVPVTSIALVEEALGRALTPAEGGRAAYYIRTVSAFIAGYCDRISFAEVEDDVLNAQADYYGIIELGGGPISAVTSVAAVGGSEVDGWTFDGTARIHGLSPFQSVAVTYTHGADTIPEDVQAVATEAVISCISLQVSGPLKTRTVGDITYAFQEGPNAVAVLSESVLDRYVTQAYTWRLGDMSASQLPNVPINWFQIGG